MKIENIENSSLSAAVLDDENLNDSGTQSEFETSTVPGAFPIIFDGVEDIRACLGEQAVLLPIPRGEKRPHVKGWPEFTSEKMQALEYLAQLEEGNVGVVLGTASNGLCAIDIDFDDKVEPFLRLNPVLRDTLRTRGARGAQIWVQITDEEYPTLTKIQTVAGEDWGEWRADGGQSVICGIHPEGHAYSILNKATPIELAFAEINWPEDLKLPWVKTAYDELVEIEGAPFLELKNGDLNPNHIFFVRKYMLEHQVVFDSAVGEFFQYDHGSGLWKSVTPETIKRRFLADLGCVAREIGKPQLHFKRNDALANNLLALLKTEAEEFNIFSERPTSIHVKNGMIVFEQDQALLKSFHPGYFSRNACPYDYDPHAECPRFLNELLASALSAEDIVLVQKWAGSVLLGKNDAQRFLMLVGTAGGGKSTLMTILERTIGLQNVAQMRTEHLADRFELFGFVGKTLLVGKDVAAEFLKHKSAHVIKALVGGDLMDTEKKGFNQRVQIRGDFNLGITCNSDLIIRLEGDVAAWRRRLLIVRYEKPAPGKKIPGFAEQLLAEEGPGILRWMVEGAMALIKDLRLTGDYALAEIQKQEIEGILEQSDSIKLFVRDCLVMTHLDVTVTIRELQAAYYKYCEIKGWPAMSDRDVSRQLPQHILEIHKANRRNDIMRDSKGQSGYSKLQIVEGDWNEP